VLAGGRDRLVTQNVTEREAREALEAFVELVDAKKIEAMKDRGRRE
jgi:hypothetical protein